MMGILSLTVGLACTATALITILLCWPARRRGSAWDVIHGVERPPAFASDTAWRRLNRYAATRMMWWSVPVLLLGIVALFISFEERPLLSVPFGLAPLLILGGVFETVRYARRDRDRGPA
jgi:hypothetical protein